MEQEVLTVKEVAQFLRVTEDTIYRLTRQGKLPSFRVGRHIRFYKTAIEQYIRGQHQHTQQEQN